MPRTVARALVSIPEDFLNFSSENASDEGESTVPLLTENSATLQVSCRWQAVTLPRRGWATAALPGERFLAWQFPLHTGLAFGRVGQIVIAVTGLAIVALSVTGFYVWWRKWRERRRAHMRTPRNRDAVRRRLVAAAAAALLVGALTVYGPAAQTGYPRS